MRLGCDPEVFLQTPTGEVFSAIGYINADKWNPKQLENLPEGFTVQEDNVALEFGIPPASTEDEWVHHIKLVMEESKKYLPEGTMFSKLSCTIFPEKEMEHPAAHIFGCEPDFDAWTGDVNSKPKPPHKFLRSAGGHIHVETKDNPYRVAQAMDLFLSVPAVIMDNGIERKQLYGKSGAIREKPYGVEYRSLSNFWIHDEKLMRWAWRNTARALDCNLNLEKMQDVIRGTIDTNNRKLAWSLIQQYNLEVV